MPLSSSRGCDEIANDPMGVEISDIFVSLKPRSEWTTTNDREVLVSMIRERLEKVPGMTFPFSQPIALRVDELVSGVKSQEAVKIFGEDMEVLKTKGEEIARILETIRGAEDVMAEKVTGVGYLEVDIQREAIARYGIHIADIQDTLEVAVGGKKVSELFEGEKRFAVAVRYPSSGFNSPEKIGEVLIPAPNGARIPLKHLARIYTEVGPAQISRESGSRRIVVESNVSGRDIGSFVSDAQKAIEAKVKLPPGYFTTWGGQFENQQRAMARLSVIVPICLILIFILLFSTFGLVRQAFLIILNNGRTESQTLEQREEGQWNMREIKAYIKPHRLSNVTLALQEIKGLSGMSISEVKGFGRGRAKTAPDRITEDFLNFIPRFKIEVVCHDDLVEEVVATIQQNAYTGIRGDGKIFVSNVEAAVRISTGESGESAV